MSSLEIVVAVLGLFATVAFGLVAHEWTHALVLALGRVEYDIVYFPDRSDGVLGVLASYPWAYVQPSHDSADSPLTLRLAALAPLSLALPVFVLVTVGFEPSTHPLYAAVTIGVLACALPSPQDFSVAFYAHRLLE